MTLKQSFGRLIYALSPLNRRATNIIRYEFASFILRTLNCFNPKYISKIRILRTKKNLKINLGSGGKGLPGWVNFDMHAHPSDQSIALDIRRALPLSDGSADIILAEHVLEHLDVVEDVPLFLKECFRVLAYGGVLRVIVPDCEKYCRAYADTDQSAFLQLGWDIDNLPADMPTKMYILNHQFQQGGEHLFGWDFETIYLFLKKAGFGSVEKMGYKVSVNQDAAIDQENHARYSLYVDAVK